MDPDHPKPRAAPAGASPRSHQMSSPRLDKDELLTLDACLLALLAALESTPTPDYDTLAAEARTILGSVERQLTNEGREKYPQERQSPKPPDCWDWESEWREIGSLTWTRFGDQRVPVWKAMHEAFSALVAFVLDPKTGRQRLEYADELAGA